MRLDQNADELRVGPAWIGPAQEREATSMVSFLVRLKFAQEDRAESAEAVQRLAEASRNEPGCVSYVPHHSEEDLDTVVIYEQYVDENALKAHRESEHFKKYAVGVLYQAMRERAVENLIALA